MKKLLKTLAISGIVIMVTITAHASLFPAQLQNFQLCGGGASYGATSVCLQSFQDTSGNNLSMSSFGSLGFGTIEPGNGSQEESITWNGITQNSNGTANLTGVQDVSLLYPFATTTGITINHAGSVTFVVANTSYFYYRMFAILDNLENITGQWNFTSAIPTITSTATTSLQIPNLATVQSYINSATSSLLSSVNTWTNTNVFSGTVNLNGNAILGTTLNLNTNKITNLATPTNPTDGATKAYVDSVAIQGAPISSNTATGLGRTASSTQIARGLSGGTTTPYFIPSTLASSTASTTSSIVVVTSPLTGQIDPSFIATNPTQVFFSSTTGSATWTKPIAAKAVQVIAIGGGGGGATANGALNSGGGGSGAEYVSNTFNASALPATVSYFVGFGGNANQNGSSTTFGTFLTALGGLAGNTNGTGANGVVFSTVGGSNSGGNGTFGGGGGGTNSISYGGSGSNGNILYAGAGGGGGGFNFSGGSGGVSPNEIGTNTIIGLGSGGNGGNGAATSNGNGQSGFSASSFGGGGGGGGVSGGSLGVAGQGGQGASGAIEIITFF